MKHLIFTFIFCFASLSAMAFDNYAKNGNQYHYNINSQLQVQYDDAEFHFFYSVDKVSHSKKNRQGKWVTTYQYLNWQTFTSDIPTFLEYCLYAQQVLREKKLAVIRDNVGAQLKFVGVPSRQGKIEYNSYLQYQFDWVITDKGEVYATLWHETYNGYKCVGRFNEHEILLMQKNVSAMYAAWNERNRSMQVRQDIKQRVLNNIDNLTY